MLNVLTAFRALKRALTVLSGFLDPTTYIKYILQNNSIMPRNMIKPQFKFHTLDFTFFKPARFNTVCTILPAFIPVKVWPGQR